MQLLKKITPKTLGVKAKDIIEHIDEGQSLKVYSLAGRVTDLKGYTSQYGDGFLLVGQFLAVRDDGEEAQSTVAVLPEPMMTMVVDKFTSTGEVIEFGVDVLIRRDDSMPLGYEWLVRPVNQPEPVELRGLLTSDK